MKILFLSRWFPYPADNGAKIRIYQLLKGLAVVHSVDLISFCEGAVDESQLAGLSGVCAQVATVPYQPFKPGRLRALLGFFSLRPRSVVDTFNRAMMAEVKKAAGRGYDLIIASEIDMAPYALAISGPKKILEELEISKIFDVYQGEKTFLRRVRSGLTWFKLTAYTRELLKRFDGCTVVSNLELGVVQKAAPGALNVRIIPNGVDSMYYSRIAPVEFEPNSLIYSGALTYAVNFEAVEYFLREIFPLILQSRPDTRFYITGRIQNVPIERLPNLDQVVFTGYVNDIRPVIAARCVSVVPLLTGGGTRLKILESMAIGTPVVSTSKGAEGLNLSPGRDILIADSPEQFADAVLGLMANASLRSAIASRAKVVAGAIYDWRFIAKELLDCIGEWTDPKAAVNR